MDLSEAATQKYVAGRISSLIQLSVGEAVMRSEVAIKRGIVETGEIKEVKPDDEKK